MRSRALAVLALAVLLAAFPTAAQAKGATAATINGGGPGGLPGGPISLRGDGEPGTSTDLGMLAQGTGLYVVVFGGDPGALLKASPTASAPATPSPGPSPTPPAVRTRSASTSGRTRPAAR